ncbi:MAG: hypothetical protein WC602_05495 [archaeon]
MKRLLCLILIPIGLFAQLPDTVISNASLKLPCKISRFEDTRVLLDEKNGFMIVNLTPNIFQIWLSEKGIVYTKSDGYVAALTDLNQFLKEREKRAKKERSQKQKPGIEGWTRITTNRSDSTRAEESIPRGSIGIQVSPLNFYSVIQVDADEDYLDETIMRYGSASVGSNIAWRITKKLSIVGEIWHFSEKEIGRYEDYYNSSYTSEYTSESKYKVTTELSLWKIIGGIEWSLLAPRPKRVSPFLTAGIGKQFAFYNYKYDNLDEEPSSSTTTTKSNFEEFMEDVNSPFFLYVGYGAEYFFNDSFSIFTHIRYTHQRIRGTYHYKQENTSTEYLLNIENKIDQSNTQQDISIGLNFYF